MWRLLICFIVLLGPLAALAQPAEEITATVKEERVKEPDEANRQGLEMLKRDLTLGNMAIRYRQLVDPKQGDKPLNQRYGDYILGCDFPRYSWNWDLQYFLDVTVTRPGQPPFIANRTMAQSAIHVMAQGLRGVADMVWPLPGKGELVVRLVKLAEDPSWFYLRATIEGDDEAKITLVRVSSYPTITSGPPERQRWVTTPTRGLQMTNQPTALTPADEWALVLHNRYVHEDGGALLVMDPAQITAATAGETYPISIRMTPKPTTSVALALGYFWDTPYQKAIAAYQSEAAERLKRLRQLDWTVHPDLPAWEREKQQIEELLAGTGQGQYGATWAEMQRQAEELRSKPGDQAASRKLVLLIRQARALRAQLYEPALQRLIETGTR
jgi:hypothetical protein